MTGLPGSGKSLLLQQLALIARESGRKVHLLQWVMARKAFETPENLVKYPEKNGITHQVIRKAVGIWSREAVLHWHEAFADPEHILIGELPLIGNRLTELTQIYRDACEPLLSDVPALFLTPVPSWEVREVIEAARAKTLAEPRHEREKRDAPPNVLQKLWSDVNGLARQMGMTKAPDDSPYNPYIYGGVYDALLQFRNHETMMIDRVLDPRQSVYDFDVVESELRASDEQVQTIMRQLESSFTAAELEHIVDNWHLPITESPKVIDPGPLLSLPLPEDLCQVIEKTQLSADEAQALDGIIDLPLNAKAQEIIPCLELALVALADHMPAEVVAAGVHKFDVYDGYFNVQRLSGDPGRAFIRGLLMSYRNVLENLDAGHDLSVVELPLLRVALESTLRLFRPSSLEKKDA